MALIQNPEVMQWLNADWSFLRTPEDNFKNKTAEKAALDERQNDWAWKLCGAALPTHKYPRDCKWSGKFGQLIFEEMLPGGWKPKKKGKFLPDWEDENFVYELKTQFHLSGGTAQEKIPAVPIKYIDVPELFGKPLRIVCFAGAETYTKTFLKDSPKIQTQLALWKDWQIEFVWGSSIKG